MHVNNKLVPLVPDACFFEVFLGQNCTFSKLIEILVCTYHFEAFHYAFIVFPVIFWNVVANAWFSP